MIIVISDQLINIDFERNRKYLVIGRDLRDYTS